MQMVQLVSVCLACGRLGVRILAATYQLSLKNRFSHKTGSDSSTAKHLAIGMSVMGL